MKNIIMIAFLMLLVSCGGSSNLTDDLEHSSTGEYLTEGREETEEVLTEAFNEADDVLTSIGNATENAFENAEDFVRSLLKKFQP